jgi:hypothetical protein
MREERKPLWPWIVAVLTGLPVLYVASFGPACWIVSHANLSGKIATVPYRPMIWSWQYGPEFLSRTIYRYSTVGAAKGWDWSLPLDQNLSAEVIPVSRWQWKNR